MKEKVKQTVKVWIVKNKKEEKKNGSN